MKEKLIELLKQCQKECDETCCEQCIYDNSFDCGNEHIADFLFKHGVMVSDPLKAGKECVSMDYEAEYHKLFDKHSLLYADYQAMESEFVRMRAQLDIVHLIFSK